MMMLLKFAFRNVLKNKKRSLLTASAVFFAALIVAAAMGWVNGMLRMMLDGYVKFQTGNVRVTTEGFIKREKFVPVDEIVTDSGQLSGKIRQIQGVSAAEERIKFGIMLGNGDNTVYAFGMGMDISNSILNIQSKIKQGAIGENGIYIGINLAKKLNVKLGDPLLLVTKTSEGGINGIKLPIKGIFQFHMTTFDDQFFFISLSDARKLLKIPSGSSELLIFTENKAPIDKIKKDIQKMLPEGVAAKDVREQLGQLYSFFDVGKIIYYFIYMVIIFLASFVVINTMMMAIFERVREIGTLKAMGMTDNEIFINFIMEGGIIGAAGGITGGTLGYIANMFFNKTGINLDFAFQGLSMPMEYIIRPEMSPDILVVTIILGILIPAIATIYPSNYARKLMPAEALRKL